SAGDRGYAPHEWSGSTWLFQIRLQTPSGIIAIPAIQPFPDGLSGLLLCLAFRVMNIDVCSIL
ncbi:hypothetical protein, partial [Aurantimonas sp. NFXS3]|uniref:hypothetical protein n=1 Tax=Aurantimonas sp. NFXS3 TaxID=2818434 RepID=UPI003B8DD1DD